LSFWGKYQNQLVAQTNLHRGRDSRQE
jgi:hypothetical protein